MRREGVGGEIAYNIRGLYELLLFDICLSITLQFVQLKGLKKKLRKPKPWKHIEDHNRTIKANA
jgi:hypothetical protein